MLKNKLFDRAGFSKASNNKASERRALGVTKCHICNLNVSKSVWSFHQQSHFTANKSRLFRCKVCEKGFTNSFYLRQHLQAAHDWENKKPRTCDKCGTYFESTSAVVLHKSVVDCAYEPLECRMCEDKFPNASTLRAHMLKIHGAFLTAVKQSRPTFQAKCEGTSPVSRTKPTLPLSSASISNNNNNNNNIVAPVPKRIQEHNSISIHSTPSPIQEQSSISNDGYFESEDCDFSNFQVVDMDSLISADTPNEGHKLLTVRDVTSYPLPTSSESSSEQPGPDRTKTFILEPVYRSQLIGDSNTKSPSGVGSSLPREELTIKVSPDLTIKVLKTVVNRPRDLNVQRAPEPPKPAAKKHPTFTRSIGILGKKARKEPVVVEKRRPIQLARNKYSKAVLPPEMRYVAQDISTKLTGVTESGFKNSRTADKASKARLRRVEKQFLTRATAVAKDVLSFDPKWDESERKIIGRNKSRSSRTTTTIVEESSFKYDPVSRTYAFDRRQARKVPALAVGELAPLALAVGDEVDIERERTPTPDREDMIDAMDLGDYMDTVMSK